MEATKKYVRRTAEQRLADLEKQQAEIMERQSAALAKIEEEKKKLMQSPSSRKKNLEQEKRFARAASPDWDFRHYIAAIEKVLADSADAADLSVRGEALLAEHGKGKRGRRPKNG
jgi:phage gpG-like protein